ncbi:hypothetical protein LWI29_016329 [Acer saccharum]|uniref:RRM domain-containing protein n=1 Tax=Acer saccharum TaxID=4024 RepID=A0AA39SB90_ACESA|nr:hypothetical protein LWI29_016329 [Acer saccharum]
MLMRSPNHNTETKVIIMAFFSKVGSLLRQTASKQIGYELSASRSSIYQATRCMSSSKVFVGGLSFNIDDTSLREVFKKYGYVAEARVILDRDTGRSRGFGFVTFNTEEEASFAIQALDGQDIHGRVVKVNYAIDRARGGGGGYGGGGGGYGGGGGGYGGGGGGYGGGANNYGSGGNYSSSYGGGNASYGGAGGNTFDSGNTGGISSGSENYGVAGGGGGSIDGNTNNQFGSAGNQFGSADNQFGSFDSNESGSLTGAPDGPMEGNGDGFDDSSDFAKRA